MLTGKTRYRIGWRKRLVLQVEYMTLDQRGSAWIIINRGLVKLWRDATVEDIQAVNGGDVIMGDEKNGMFIHRHNSNNEDGMVAKPVQKMMADAFNQWMQDYTNDPQAFEDINASAMLFLNEKLAGKEPAYGETCAALLAAYMVKIDGHVPPRLIPDPKPVR